MQMFSYLKDKIEKMSKAIVKEDEKGYYTIVAPGTIQPDYEYVVTVTVHDNAEPATIKVGISGPAYNETKTIEVSPFSSEMVQFDVPSSLQDDDDYELQTEGISGLIFKETSKLNYKCEKPKVYIQTDKAMYKPGDLVQYRILALDENAKPAKLKEPLNLNIRDGAYNQIKQIKDLQFIKGVYTGKFQLSEQPVLGNWTIDVTAGEECNSKTDKSFEVAKYVLPKFSVEIEADKEVAVLDKVVKITVRSKYTYGKPVKGKATIRAKFHSYSDNTPVAEKTINIDGKGDVEFNFMDDLKMEHQIGYYTPEINVEATMTEAFTGLQQSTTSSINVRSSRYTITIPNMSKEYEINKPFEIRAVIKKLNGSAVTNAKSTAKLIIGCYYGAGSNFLMFETEVDANGIAVFKLKFTKDGDYHRLSVMYEEETYSTHGFKIKKDKESSSEKETNDSSTDIDEPLKLFPQNKNPNLGEEFIIDVKSEKSLTYFVYTIMARGKIIKHEYVKVNDAAGAANTKCHSLKMTATFEMAPKAKIYVYFVENGEMHYDETTITLPKKFENKLEITAPGEAKASDVVTLNIKTDPDSFVGLLGVDQSVVLLQTGNDFDEKLIFKELSCYESDTPYGRSYMSAPPGYSSGFVTITNASCSDSARDYRYGYGRHCFSYLRAEPTRYARNTMHACYEPSDEPYDDYCVNFDSVESVENTKANIIEPPKIRKDFAENWIFDDIESTDSNGLASFTKKIPDTITSWVITGFSLNENTGFGMTEDATKIRVFQPFFLSTNLPYSIKRGEVITVPVVVFNYMENSLNAEITMDNEDNEYDFINESPSDDKNPNQITKKLTIASNCGETVSFTIKPKIVGEIMLKIKAITPLAGDAIHQKLKVEPEGVTQYENEALFINIPNGEPVKHTLKAEIPSNVILDSEYIEFMAVGDILGPTIKNIDELVRMPSGCGEQNMINFVPNILVLQYLEAIKKDMPSIVLKAKKYMEIGYQRELTYKHKDGSYSAFGEGSDEANSWLTAYVVRSFIQARKFITIDDKIIDEALEFLMKTQKDNGQFPQTGTLFYSSNQNELGVSAFILLALLEDKEYALKYQTQIEKSLQYLHDNVEKEDDVYSLALILLVFQKSKHPHAEKIKEKLELKSKFENNLKWWSILWNNNDVEVTAYILQALVETEEAGKLLPTIKWLIGQRNSLGGFDSTQDTVVGLKALVTFAEKYVAGGDGIMTIEFEAQNDEGSETTTGKFNVDKENSLILQSHVLPKSTRLVSLTAEGEGSALIQLSYRYNIATQDQTPSFLIKHTPPLPELFPEQLSMNVSAEYKPQSEDIRESNMAVMEICMPSGYTTHNDSLQPIRGTARVQRVDMKNDETVIIVYFESLVAGEPICFDVIADKSHTVYELKPAAITIYDYYNTELRATAYYEVNL